MISLEWVYFACGCGLGTVIATACMVGAALYDDWRNSNAKRN